MTEWNGKPERAGWHWLERRNDKALRMAFGDPKRLNWWVSDEEGRTRWMSDLLVHQTYTYRAFLEPPLAATTKNANQSRRDQTLGPCRGPAVLHHPKGHHLIGLHKRFDSEACNGLTARSEPLDPGPELDLPRPGTAVLLDQMKVRAGNGVWIRA